MLYEQILSAKKESKKLLAILIDPDKVVMNDISVLTTKIKLSPATHIFVGGSSFEGNHLDEIIIRLKSEINLPILLFPGNPSQISAEADGILFLMLLSGRNPDYLVEHQINAVPILEKTNLEIISTGYILIESGSETAVERVSKTKPLPKTNAVGASLCVYASSIMLPSVCSMASTLYPFAFKSNTASTVFS